MPLEVSIANAMSLRLALESPSATLSSKVSLANAMVDPIGAARVVAASKR